MIVSLEIMSDKIEYRDVYELDSDMTINQFIDHIEDKFGEDVVNIKIKSIEGEEHLFNLDDLVSKYQDDDDTFEVYTEEINVKNDIYLYRPENRITFDIYQNFYKTGKTTDNIRELRNLFLSAMQAYTTEHRNGNSRRALAAAKQKVDVEVEKLKTAKNRRALFLAYKQLNTSGLWIVTLLSPDINNRINLKPSDIAADNVGNLYVVSERLRKIFKIPQNVEITPFAETVEFSSPRTLCYFKEKLYVGDDRLIREIDIKNQQVKTLAGNTDPEKEDIYNIVSGVGSEANFYELESIRPTDDGTLKVNCEDNLAIVELNGKVTKIETPDYDNWVERQARDAEGNTYYFREGAFIIQSPDGSKHSYNQDIEMPLFDGPIELAGFGDIYNNIGCTYDPVTHRVFFCNGDAIRVIEVVNDTTPTNLNKKAKQTILEELKAIPPTEVFPGGKNYHAAMNRFVARPNISRRKTRKERKAKKSRKYNSRRR
jgi:hypothetical protein